jgi:CRP/FNR family transcriptional regulator, nitrogen oxide reductase regulator
MANGVIPGLLEQAELFRGLGPEGLAAATGCASRVSLRSGAQLLKQGDPAIHLFMLEHGRIKMSVVSPEGTEVTLRFMRNGDIIGCAAVFRGIAYPASGTATEDTSVLCWSASQINDLIRRFPQLASNALSIVSGRAEEFLQRFRENATERVEQRIARALLRVAATRGASSGDERIAVSRQHLAEIANTSLYTVSRTVSSWARQKLVTAGRGHITIRDAG